MVKIHSLPASSAAIERWFSTDGFVWFTEPFAVQKKLRKALLNWTKIKTPLDDSQFFDWRFKQFYVNIKNCENFSLTKSFNFVDKNVCLNLEIEKNKIRILLCNWHSDLNKVKI